MSVIDRTHQSAAPISGRQARKDKAAAADTVSNHALGIFRQAVEELDIADELLYESIAEDTEIVTDAQARIQRAEAARAANAKVKTNIEAIQA